MGSLPWGLIVGYIWLRRDIRESGSGKTGTTNVLRTAGKIPGGTDVVIVDIAKGTVPALVGRYVFDSDGAAVAGACAAVVGHIWPVFAGFRGGRSGEHVWWRAGAGAAAVARVPGDRRAAGHRHALVSVMSVVGVPVCAALIGGVLRSDAGWAERLDLLCIRRLRDAVGGYKHIPNIQRLRAGDQPKIGQGGNRPATG